MQLTLYHLKNSRSQRILWLLEELDLPYQLKVYQQHILENDADELKKINPHAKFPTLVLANATQQTPIVLTETSAIAEYCSHQANVYGIQHLNQQEIIDYYFWKNFADSNFMPNLALKQMFRKLVQRTPFPMHIMTGLIKRGVDRGFLNPTLEQQLTMIDSQLQHHEWITGQHFTIADILLWFPLQACVQLNQKYQQYPEIKRYLIQIESRPAFKTALVKGQWSAQTFQEYWSSAY
ncbi:glutathione S-transferase family protein [Acinetobacter wuhouensis]|uniref:Glutathione S-transferase n=1 Tax=Acinetobacter wuhouensis TaxID=1879050 RepID=A0A4Q7AGL5_9GAMM|nr:glutathione S-transferase [Acinetobacter wuhouensis]RZG46728.1 glutathione S-transferase [Acinetobacter wuhouensis]